MYIVAPNMSSYYVFPDSETAIDAEGGQSMIVDYRGAIVGKQPYSNGSTFVTGVINVEALRHHWQNAQVTNWPKDIRTHWPRSSTKSRSIPRILTPTRFQDTMPSTSAT